MSDKLQERIAAAVRRRLERVFDEASACDPSGLFPPPPDPCRSGRFAT